MPIAASAINAYSAISSPAAYARLHAMAHRKNPAAVALGRLGGLAAAGKGLKATHASRTPAERSALARKAALARWGIKKLPPKRKPPLRGR